MRFCENKNSKKKNLVLTTREVEVLSLLAHGKRTDQIAYHMGVSRATVEFHIRNARTKTGSSTREQAVARALASGEIKM